jgi:peptidyl-prolyl cis-trans isomerase SurA
MASQVGKVARCQAGRRADGRVDRIDDVMRSERERSGQTGVQLRLLAGVAAALLVHGSGPSPARAEVVDRVVASIDGEPVTQSELEGWVRTRRLGVEPSREVLETYVTEELLEKEAKAQGIQARDADVERYIAQVKAQGRLDDAAFDRALREQGLTKEVYRENVRREIEKSELVNKEVRGRVSVSPEEVRRHYEEHKKDYSVAERVRLRMILIPTQPNMPPEMAMQAEAFVRALHLELQNGADFAEMARQYSRGPGAAEGGDLGFFRRGELVKPLEDVAFRLREGALSDPIQSPTGFHLLKVEERQGTIEQPFDVVKDQIRAELYDSALERRYQNWLRDGLREAHHVEILW